MQWPRCSRFAWMLVVVSMLVMLVPSLARADAEGSAGQSASWDELAGARVAILTGAPFEDAMREKCPDVGEIMYFASTPDMIAAINAGKVDFFVSNEAVGALAANKNSNIEMYPEPLIESEMGVVFPKGSEWAKQFSAITERMRTDGTADKLWEKWTGTDDSVKTIPEQDWAGSNGTLKVVACQSMEPVSYVGAGQVLGYDVETLLLAAKELDVHLEFVPAEFSEVLAFLQAGKADIGCGSILITPERAEAMDFARTHDNDLVLMARVDGEAATTKTPDAARELEIANIDDLIGKRIGVPAGAAFDSLLLDAYEGISESDLSYFNSIAELIGALQAKKIDAFVADQPIAQLAVNRYDGIGIIPEPLVEDHYALALQKDSPLTPQFNEVLAQMRADGTLDEICQRWTGADEAAKVMPAQDWDAPNGTIVAAASPEVEPSCYLKNNEVVGFSTEILFHIARELGYRVEIREMSVPALIAELQSGKVDVGLSCLSITEERKKVVDMTDSYYDGGVMAVVRDAGGASGTNEVGFLEGVAASFERTFITEDRWKLICSGLSVTVIVTLLSGLLGTALGFVTVLLRRRGNRIAGAIVNAFEGLMGRLPIVVVLMVFYYVVFGSVDLPAIAVAVLVFTLAFGASAGSIMWNAVRSVDVGQSEASLALGFNDNQTFMGVVLPQAARQFMPVLSGQLVSLAKDTSVVGYIAVQDLTRAGDLIRSRTMEAFFPLISTAAIYFALCCLLAAGMGVIIRKLDIERRPRTIKGVEL